LSSHLSVASIRRRTESGIIVNGLRVEVYKGQDILCNRNMFEWGRIICWIHEGPLKAEVSWSGSLSWNGCWSNVIIDCSKLQPVILPDGMPCQQSQNSSEDDSRKTTIVFLSPARAPSKCGGSRLQARPKDKLELKRL
jgi:hypothetical protein